MTETERRERRRELARVTGLGLAECAKQGRVDAAAERPWTRPFDPCINAVAEWRARGMAGLRNRHFRKRSQLARAMISLDIQLRWPLYLTRLTDPGFPNARPERRWGSS